MLQLWRPFRTSMLDRFFDRSLNLDRVFEDWRPAADIYEEDGAYMVKVELPGVTKEDIKVTLKDEVLTIFGERKLEKEEKKRNYHRVERSYGSFSRSFHIGETVDHDKIEAKFENGVLEVRLPKGEKALPKQIEVQN